MLYVLSKLGSLKCKYDAQESQIYSHFKLYISFVNIMVDFKLLDCLLLTQFYSDWLLHVLSSSAFSLSLSVL